MDIFNSIDIYLFLFFVSLILYFDLLNKFDKNSMQDKLFMSMIILNAIAMVSEGLYIAVNNKQGTIFIAINIVSNIIVFCSTTILEVLWILYIDYQVYHDETRQKKYYIPITCILALYIFMTAASPYAGWVFYVDKVNSYSRGYLFYISVIINLGLILYALIFIVTKRKKIKPSYYWSLFLFILPPVVLAIIQFIFYGLELIWGGITLSMLIIYFNVQNDSMNTDYLTGAYNRKKLDSYIRDKIADSNEHKTFSAIMIDLNDFKKINDNFGHPIGDIALKDTVKIIENVVRHKDFVARFGGDEFVIVMDINTDDELEQIMTQIECAVMQFNETQNNPYNLSLCMGYAVYNYNSKMNSSEFIKYVDGLMYENKRIYKAMHKN